ncbi:disease resistance protein RPV1-like [Argentina anserina]|uniref:disease resistance protein RPV1-like n=1 Tax=Argentina anserina TaxID=57926 RepID=UPI0021765BF7|nr:disease resistance protein RPV1-like [Potentilla anserina]
MSATSSSAAGHGHPRGKYDVFLSFRGKDTRDTFTNELYKALKWKNIDTYIDNKLEGGDEIKHALEAAIEQSQISVIVFSENYAASTWCLDELVYIMKCKKSYGQIVLPVFYKVDPSDVRHQKNSYEVAFRKHTKRFKNNPDKVWIWKDYLKDAAALSGYHSKSYRTEPALIDTIVKQVLKKLNCISSTKSRGLFGIENQIQEIELLLSMQAEDDRVRYIGIWGTNGMGKTTLAREVFRRLYSEFDSCSFLENVREKSEKNGIYHVRQILLCQLLKEESLDNVGTSDILEKLSNKKVLVVLDDVHDSSQIEALLGDLVFRWGSRIIITSTDKRSLMDRVNGLYKMKKLEIDDALQLFHSKAPQDDRSKTNCLDLSRRAVEIARGVPLLITTMSSSFGDCKTRRDWGDVMNRLQKFQNKEVGDMLRASYNELQDEEKGIFLDIACFLKGKKIAEAERMLEMHGFSARSGIQSLVNKCLISISSDDHLDMHVRLQEMGQSIVREQGTDNPGQRSRLWNANDVYQVFIKEQGHKLEAIWSDISTIEELQLSPNAFENMPNLRVLRFYAQPDVDTNMHLPAGLEFLPGGLRYLHWERYPSTYLPLVSSPHNLVELHLPYGKVKKLWNNNGKNMENLKMLNLKGCKLLTEVPNFSQSPDIETLNLSGCRNLTEIDVRELAKLTTLKLSGCSGLGISRDKPEMPPNVRKLDLSYLELTQPPNLSGCPNIEKFNLHHCEKLARLPHGYFNHLAKLTTLNMAHCPSLKTSPQVPRNLRTLDLSSCSGLTEFLDFPQCSNIEIIDFCECTSLRQLPLLKDLDKLTRLELAGCSNLEGCPELPRNIQKLDLSSCSQLTEVPDLSGCPNIEIIDLCHCTGLEELPMLKHLDKLTYLELAGCSSLEVCPELPRNIRDLDLSNCSKLIEVPDLSDCPNIENLDLCHCTSLKHIRYSCVRNLDKLTSLYLENCSSLEN